MNGFLVIARCPMDDVVLRGFTNKDDAAEYLRKTSEEEALAEARRIWVGGGIGDGLSYVISLLVMEIKDGIPVPVPGDASARVFEE